MKPFLILLLALWCCSPLFAQKEIPLYDGPVPNARKVADPERMVERGPDNRAFFDTAIPSLTIFQPQHANGKAVVICPGGGYVKTAFDKEGTRVARALLTDSITAFVLKYRIPQDLTNVDRSLAPLQDAQQAIRFVRKHAVEYGVEADKIGIMGFSAGGHLAASAATHFDKMADSNELDTTSVRPDFVVLVYPVISFMDEITHQGSRQHLIGEQPDQAAILEWSNEKQVNAQSPPAFLVHAADDRSVPVQNSIAYYLACLEHDVPVEMHLYPSGGHGFGLYNETTADNWLNRLRNWLKNI
ncbi:MAG: alpha/beta hydrolase [Saprospiraceae bacterium]|nr:alpha/beta hydrolase [Saprospiraceae bacterium]